MEELYLRIADRLQNNVEGLTLIDEDTGQLYENADGYPVTFPCALVDVATVDWENFRGAEQRGTARLSFQDMSPDLTRNSRRWKLRYQAVRPRVRQYPSSLPRPNAATHRT